MGNGGALIMQSFGEAEAALFMSDAGLTFYSGPGRTRNFVDARLRRLGSLIERANALLGESWIPKEPPAGPPDPRR